MIGVIVIRTLNAPVFASEPWRPSQSVTNQCNVYQASASWALLGKRGGASVDHMLSQVDMGHENEATKAVIRSGVRAAYSTPSQNFYNECLESLRAADGEKQDGIKKVKGRWMCQAPGSVDSTQIWLSYNSDSTYSVRSPTKDWLYGTFTVDGDFVVEHLGGNPDRETQRRIAHDDNGALSLNGLTCRPR